MPAKAGIHLRFRWKTKENLDSGLRRNDERESLLLIDDFSTFRLRGEDHSVRATTTRKIRVRSRSQVAGPKVGEISRFRMLLTPTTDGSLNCYSARSTSTPSG